MSEDPAMVMYREILAGVPKADSKTANSSHSLSAMWDRIQSEVNTELPDGASWEIPFDGLTDGGAMEAPDAGPERPQAT